MTSDEQGLLAAVLESPGDDTPRLVYADWLEEHGEEARAEFIRVQCELARQDAEAAALPKDRVMDFDWEVDAAERRRALCRREQELFFGDLLAAVYEGDLPPGVFSHGLDTACRTSGPVAVWRRGFVDEVRCSGVDWRRHGPVIVRRQPVTKVVLSEPTGVDYWVGVDSSRRLIEWAKQEERVGYESPLPEALV